MDEEVYPYCRLYNRRVHQFCQISRTFPKEWGWDFKRTRLVQLVGQRNIAVTRFVTFEKTRVQIRWNLCTTKLMVSLSWSYWNSHKQGIPGFYVKNQSVICNITFPTNVRNSFFENPKMLYLYHVTVLITIFCRVYIRFGTVLRESLGIR